MKISAKIDYACRALIELGLHWPNDRPLQIPVIGKRQGIPTNFLTHILINLKQLGLVESTRGKSGGYFLAKSPEQITLKEIINNFGGQGILSQHPHKGAKRVTDLIWQEIDQDIFRRMEAMTLLMMCERVKNQNKNLTFEI